MPKDLLPLPDANDRAPWRQWLDQPLSGLWCAAGWCVASAIFVGFIVILGGPSGGDSVQSTYSTWAIAHGHLSCAFPSGVADAPGVLSPSTFVAPVYPFLSGVISAITGIGRQVAFPSATALGPHCIHAFRAMNTWSIQAKAMNPTLRVAYLAWLPLLAGVVSFLRATGRGRRRWEPVTVVIVAALPPVWMCVENYFHPQDLVAMGFALAALACVLRDRWAAAGLLIALAYLSQQFALLVAAPLLVLAPPPRRLHYAASAIGAAFLAMIALLVFTSTDGVRAAILGSGYSNGTGGTVVWALGLHGVQLLLLSRILPIALSLALAWWVVRRLGHDVALEPLMLIAVVALSLSLRLAFEQNIYSYYYMALAVSLVLLDVVRGHIRGSFVAWVTMVTVVYSVDTLSVVFYRLSWYQGARKWFPVLVMAAALMMALLAVRSRARGKALIWLGLAVGSLVSWPDTTNPLNHRFPAWFWQVILVALGIALAAGPILSQIRQGSAAHGSSLATDVPLSV
jgi:hypothetical protein